MDFVRVAAALSDFLRKERFPFAVAGAFALHAYGVSRATADLDFVTDAGARDPLVAFLVSLGYETLHVSQGFSNHVHQDPALGRVDIIYVEGDTSRRLFAEAATVLRLDSGLELPVPTPEHIIAMKVHAMKNDPRRTFQEMADIQRLLLLPGIDRAQVALAFERAGLRRKYDEILESL
ncbi:MAG: hypothetical protein ACREAA_10365 [Candidatus Polarisedimenticolia bacterium]